MKNVVIIPARFASSRFPGKPLIAIEGTDGIKRPLIEHTWKVAKNVTKADAVYVATDDDTIAEAVKNFGGDVLMTSPSCKNGTERCAQCLDSLPSTVELVINLQGDAPLTPSAFVDRLVDGLTDHNLFEVATPVLRCDQKAKDRLLNDRRNGRVGGTTAVFGHDYRALYFSKEVLPYGEAPVYHHVGVYAYKTNALKKFNNWNESPLEKSEGLEQLRFLEQNIPVLCVEMQSEHKEFWEINNPEDVSIVEEIFKAQA